jgi:hypothetical protein
MVKDGGTCCFLFLPSEFICKKNVTTGDRTVSSLYITYISTEMRIQFRLQSSNTSTSVSSTTYTELSSEESYELLEDEAISEDQAARMVQKWKRQKK